ncbi:MAG: UDPGP type 1 family protein [Lachnospiraceae bacterium]|nr:UDPGP type 1 family protein [Lachnospiraceae bacterium]
MTEAEIRKLLADKGQEHVLRYWEELDESEKETLKAQIEEIDWDVIAKVGEKERAAGSKIEPLATLTLSDIEKRYDEYREKGLEAIRKGRIGAVLLAGGMGTRLGSDRPKGELNVGINRELSIFNCLINNLREVTGEAGVSIPLFVMTSEKNDIETREYFKKNNYFDYPAGDVYFFVQQMAPAVDYDGKLLMEEPGRLATSPNGNGGWFASLKRAGLLDTVHQRGIDYINIFAVDNVLQRIADPVFIGATIDAGADCGSKVVMKNDPYEKVGVMCLEDGRPSIVEYYDLSDDMANEVDDKGNFTYGAGVILNYLFLVSRLEEIVDVALPVHVVEKKIPYIDGDKKLIKPEEPNGYKFESLAVDMIRLMEGCVPFEVVREKEFAPIKNLHGIDSLDSARELLQKNGIEL